MDRPIYIFGHQNPDTDSICSTIAYANLKQKLGYKNVVATRLGKINKETKYVLDYFNVDKPILIDNLKPQVIDLDLTPIKCLHEDDTLKKALGLIITQKGHVLPVVDKNERLIGITSISDIAPAYMGLAGKSLLKVTQTPFKNLIEVLEGKLLCCRNNIENITGDVYTVSEMYEGKKLNFEDVIISNLNDSHVDKAFNSGSGYIILAESLHSDRVIEIPKDYNGTVICVQYSIFEIIKLISQTIPIKTMVNKQMMEYFQVDDYLEEVKESMLTSQHRRFPIVDNLGHVQSMISRSDFLNINRKQVILVDHNEATQSATGIEEAEIVEIIDHHRVANVLTKAPLYFRAEPLGCTSTIITKIYEENEIEIDKQIAGIMLSAIISDTLLFNSPTCTKEDKRVAKKLANIVNIDIEKYGMDMIIAGTALENETGKSILYNDMKKFTIGKYKIAISQINTGDFSGFYKILGDVKEQMNILAEKEGMDIVLLMVTNIVMGGTELLAVGQERWIVESAFKIRKNELSKFLPKVFSRKKQVVPVIMNAAEL